jgi:hypothetical protein
MGNVMSECSLTVPGPQKAEMRDEIPWLMDPAIINSTRIQRCRTAVDDRAELSLTSRA